MFKSGNLVSSLLGGAALVLFLGLLIVSYFYAQLLKENSGLEVEISLLQENTKTLQQSLQKQNEALKTLQVKAGKLPKEIEVIKEIKVENSSCEAELTGYKELFKEMGK